MVNKMEFRAYDVILDGNEAYYGGEEIGLSADDYAVDFASGFVFSECECTEQVIGYHNYINTVNGIGVYYDYGADYYFFTDGE